MNEMIVEVYSPEETEKLGACLAQNAKAGSVYALDGDLGVGKTVFARGFARGLGIKGNVASPTFTIVHEYKGRLPLFHFDIYRLPTPDSLWDIGWDEYLDRGGVCLIEWASQLRECMPEDTVWMTIEKDPQKGTEYRKVTLRAQGPVPYEEKEERI